MEPRWLARLLCLSTLLLGIVLLRDEPAQGEEESAPARQPSSRTAARKARDQIVVFLKPLADRAAERNDATAAQAIAETYLWVAGVPHPDEDAYRGALKTKVAGETPADRWIVEHWRSLEEPLAVLGASPRDWDVIDARLVAQLPEVLPCVRTINQARLGCGLAPMRYDAKRSVVDIAIARRLVEAKTYERAVVGRRAHIPVEPGLATHLVLHDPLTRTLLFDPRDKGITIGSWPRALAQSDPRMPGSPTDRHLVAASCVGASGNRDMLVKVPAQPFVYPPPAVPLQRRATRVDGPHVLPAKVPEPVSLHGFGPRPGRGARIEVEHKGKPVAGRQGTLGADGAWVLVFTFEREVGSGVTYEFTARDADGTILKGWTMTTTAGAAGSSR